MTCSASLCRTLWALTAPLPTVDSKSGLQFCASSSWPSRFSPQAIFLMARVLWAGSIGRRVCVFRRRKLKKMHLNAPVSLLLGLRSHILSLVLRHLLVVHGRRKAFLVLLAYAAALLWFDRRQQPAEVCATFDGSSAARNDLAQFAKRGFNRPFIFVRRVDTLTVRAAFLLGPSGWVRWQKYICSHERDIFATGVVKISDRRERRGYGHLFLVLNWIFGLMQVQRSGQWGSIRTCCKSMLCPLLFFLSRCFRCGTARLKLRWFVCKTDKLARLIFKISRFNLSA